MSGEIRVCAGTSEDLSAILNVLDGALLETDRNQVSRAISRGDVFAAVPERRTHESGVILGALVLDGRWITSIAVRRRRRGQGIGAALVDSAAKRRDRLMAEFRAAVRPFWVSVGFEVAPASGDSQGAKPTCKRYRGVRTH